jgi:hypothetical protein
MNRDEELRRTLAAQRQRAVDMREGARQQRALADSLRDQNKSLLRRCRATLVRPRREPPGGSP